MAGAPENIHDCLSCIRPCTARTRSRSSPQSHSGRRKRDEAVSTGVGGVRATWTCVGKGRDAGDTRATTCIVVVRRHRIEEAAMAGRAAPPVWEPAGLGAAASSQPISGGATRRGRRAAGGGGEQPSRGAGGVGAGVSSSRRGGRKGTRRNFRITDMIGIGLPASACPSREGGRGARDGRPGPRFRCPLSRDRERAMVADR